MSLGGLMHDQQNTADNLIDTSDPAPVLKRGRGKLKLRVVSDYIYTTNISGDGLIWGHEEFGIWGTNKWRASHDTSFILNHNLAGILGTGELGTKSSTPTLFYTITQGPTGFPMAWGTWGTT